METKTKLWLTAAGIGIVVIILNPAAVWLGFCLMIYCSIFTLALWAIRSAFSLLTGLGQNPFNKIMAGQERMYTDLRNEAARSSNEPVTTYSAPSTPTPPKPSGPNPKDDAVAILVNLGYNKTQAKAAVGNTSGSTQDIVKTALSGINK